MSAINEIVTKEALEQLQNLIDKIRQADKAFLEMSAEGKKAFQAMATPPKTSDALNKQLKESQRLIRELQQDYKKQETALANLQKKYESLAQTKKSVNATDRQTIIDNREIRKELDGQAIANSNLTSYIQKLSVERAKASRIVADYNAQIAMGTALTEEQSAELAQATASFQKYDNAIKAGKKSIGDAREYVGQYERANWGLQNSVNQLTRELPALGINASTFFLAISNNIGPFKDATDAIKKQNEALKEQGKSFDSVGKQILSSLFSWNTALTIGVTLLTIYGSKIVEWVSSLWKGSEAMQEINNAQKEFNSINRETQNNILKETTQLKNWLQIARNSNLSYHEREIALKKITSSYPHFFEGLKTEAILNGDITNSLLKLNEAITAKEKADLMDEKVIKNKQKINDLYSANKSNIDEAIESAKNFDKAYGIAMKTDEEYTKQVIKGIISRSDWTIVGNKQKFKDDMVLLQGLLRANEKAQSQIKQLRIESIGLEEQSTESTNDNTRAIKLNTKAREDYLASEYELWKLRKENEASANKEVMETENANYDLRLQASEQYHANLIELAQRENQEQIRILEFSTKEKEDVAKSEYANRLQELDRYLKSDGANRKLYDQEVSNAKELLEYNLQGIEQESANKREMIQENLMQKTFEINKDLIWGLKRLWDEINFNKAEIEISEIELRNIKELGDLLSNVGGDMSSGKIEIELQKISEMSAKMSADIRKREATLAVERAEQNVKRLKDETELFAKTFKLSEQQTANLLNNNEALQNAEKDLIDAKKDLAKADNEVTQTQIDNKKRLKKEQEDYNDAVRDGALRLIQDVNALSDQAFSYAIDRYDREIEKNNEYYDALIENSERGSEQEQLLQEEKQRKEEELQKKKIALQRKQAMFNKMLAIAEIALNLQAELSANRKYAGTALGSLLDGIAIASAAVRTATVLATPLPQYKDGRGKGKDEFAIVGDGGRSEVIERGSGKLEVTPNVPTITHLGKDDIVHKSLEDFERSKLAIQNASIMASFGSQNRQLEMFDYYLGKELRGISSKIEKGIEKGFKKAKIQNYIKIPPIDIGHYDYKKRGLT